MRCEKLLVLCCIAFYSSLRFLFFLTLRTYSFRFVSFIWRMNRKWPFYLQIFLIYLSPARPVNDAPNKNWAHELYTWNAHACKFYSIKHCTPYSTCAPEISFIIYNTSTYTKKRGRWREGDREIITCFSISIARTFDTLKNSLVSVGAIYLSGVKSVQLENEIAGERERESERRKLEWQRKRDEKNDTSRAAQQPFERATAIKQANKQPTEKKQFNWQNGTPLKQINARTQILTEYTNS